MTTLTQPRAMTKATDLEKLADIDFLKQFGITAREFDTLFGNQPIVPTYFQNVQGEPLYFKAISTHSVQEAIDTGLYGGNDWAANMFKFGRDISTEVLRLDPYNDRTSLLVVPYNGYVRDIATRHEMEGAEASISAPQSLVLDRSKPIEMHKLHERIFAFTFDTYCDIRSVAKDSPNAYKVTPTNIDGFDRAYLNRISPAAAETAFNQSLKDAERFVAHYYS